jgi:hypothetical protein
MTAQVIESVLQLLRIVDPTLAIPTVHFIQIAKELP